MPGLPIDEPKAHSMRHCAKDPRTRGSFHCENYIFELHTWFCCKNLQLGKRGEDGFFASLRLWSVAANENSPCGEINTMNQE